MAAVIEEPTPKRFGRGRRLLGIQPAIDGVRRRLSVDAAPCHAPPTSVPHEGWSPSPKPKPCELVAQRIERGLQTFVEVGLALLEIRDRRLYREAGFTEFDAYCRERWRSPTSEHGN